MENILNKYGIEPQKMVHEDEAKQMFRDVLQNTPESSMHFTVIIFFFFLYYIVCDYITTAVLSPA